MHHNLITAIFITTMKPNGTDDPHYQHYKYTSNEKSILNCDMQKSCLEVHDPESPLSVFVFVHNVVLTTVGIFGIVGNVMSIVVLSRPEMKTSINYLLIGLSVCDTFVVTFAIVIAVLSSIFPYTGYFSDLNLYALPYIYVGLLPTWFSAQVASVYITVAITLERFVAVCHPLKSKALCTVGLAKKCVYFIIIISLIYHIPTYWENGIVKVIHDECNITVTCAYSTNFSHNHLYFTIYWEWLHSFLTFLFPFGILAYFNICISKRIKRASIRRIKFSTAQRTENDQTKILLYIVAVFFFCNSPFPIMYVHQYFFNGVNPLMMSILNQVAMSMFVLNSCVNFIIYIVVGRKFKEVFIGLFNNNTVNDKPDVKYILI